MTFENKLKKIVEKNNTLVCVGLDSDVERIPKQVRNVSVKRKQFLFNKSIIQATHDLVCSYKLNIAFYQSMGLEGISQLKMTVDFILDNFPDVPVIIDAKLGDIGSTNKGYVQFIFDYLKADAVTVNPYLGEEAMGPFLERVDKGIFVLCRTSNPGSGEFQNLVILNSFQDPAKKKMPKQVRHDKHFSLYQYVANQVTHKWNKNKNCFLVVGATYPEELKQIRKIVGDNLTFLVPGIGAQRGDLEAVLRAGLNKKRNGLIINSSRGIIFSENARAETLKLKEAINKYR